MLKKDKKINRIEIAEWIIFVFMALFAISAVFISLSAISSQTRPLNKDLSKNMADYSIYYPDIESPDELDAKKLGFNSKPEELVILILLITVVISLLGMAQVLLKLWEQHEDHNYLHKSTHSKLHSNAKKKSRKRR
ncbi:MAG: hypothetical protein ACMXX5_01455 [Candidatus Woesearchaeota archaeon]